MIESPVRTPFHSARPRGNPLWLLLAFLLLGADATSRVGAADQRPPNIVLLIADGLGAFDTDASARPDVPTPRLDALVAGGIRLTQAYATSPASEMDLKSIVSGHHPARDEAEAATAPGDDLTLGSILSSHGYVVGSFPAKRAAPATPRPGEKKVAPRFPVITREACAFMDREREKPYFLQVTWSLPDNPTEGAESRLRHYEHLGDLRRRHRAAGLAEVDEGVGLILNRLQAHKAAEKTLVIFVSQPSSDADREGLDGLSEASLRVSFVVQWTGQVPPARTDPRLCSTLDIFPTCMAAARMTLPSDLVMDGVNLLPFLQRRIGKQPHAALQWRTATAAAIRQGEWKLVRDLRKKQERLSAIRESEGGFTEVALGDVNRQQSMWNAWDTWNQRPNRPRWERWENDLQAFKENERTNAPPRDAILFLGSSTIKQWKTLASDFPETRLFARGLGGAEITDVLACFDRIVPAHKPRTIVFYAGDNDLAAGRWPEQVLADLQTFVNQARTALPGVRIMLLSIKPSPSRRGLLDQIRTTNQMIEEYCHSKADVEFVDVFTPTLGPNGQPRPEFFVQDELHLNAAGYAAWVQVLKPLLN